MSAHKSNAVAPDSVRRLDVYRVTLQLISRCQPHRHRLKRLGRRMETQLNCALASTLQNLAEGMRRTGKDRAYLLGVALGSCDEVRAILEAAVAFGVLPASEQQRVDALADRVCAMLYRLRQRCA